MARSYFCPHCRKLLNPGTKVIFLVDAEQDCELMLLSAKLGDYSAVYARSMVFEEGRIYTFRCPLCRADLTSSLDEKLVDILTLTDDDALVRVSFSRVFGEQATFVMSGHGIDQFGEHALRYESLNFFGEAPDQDE
jgi:hypothetical protein